MALANGILVTQNHPMVQDGHIGRLRTSSTGARHHNSLRKAFNNTLITTKERCRHPLGVTYESSLEDTRHVYGRHPPMPEALAKFQYGLGGATYRYTLVDKPLT